MDYGRTPSGKRLIAVRSIYGLRLIYSVQYAADYTPVKRNLAWYVTKIPAGLSKGVPDWCTDHWLLNTLILLRSYPVYLFALALIVATLFWSTCIVDNCNEDNFRIVILER